MHSKLVNEFIDKVSTLTVLVVGETIIDEFQPVIYEGQSMKSFCPVFQLTDKPAFIQEGGAAAIANHLRNFVKKVDFITNEDRQVVKTRYTDVTGKNKFIEINKFDNKKFPAISVDCSKYDMVIVADFGHGFCDKLEINDGFHLMCQTNSNNFGFNRIGKWKQKRKRSICLDLREASLQMNERLKECRDDKALELFGYEMNTDGLFITLGADGSLYTDGKEICRYPSFKTTIVDTIGAGDTFYAFSTMASHIRMKKNENLVVPSLAASLSTTWLCNEQSVTPQKLIEHANRYI